MNKEEWNNKMDNLNKKIKELGDRAKDSLDTATIKALYAKDKLDNAVTESQSNINAMKESYLIFSKEAKGKINSNLIQAQMNIEVAKKELEEKKKAYDEETLAEYVEAKAKYAEVCAELSNLAAEEAKLALLEAQKTRKEYEEKYGDK